ncbi:MAG: hypothetical protein IKA36_01650 [Clostridia bacterium]|nr:hypothetical protein [Clostridia bacterium]
MNFIERLSEGKMSNKLFKVFQDVYPVYYEYELVYFSKDVMFSIYNELKEKVSCYRLTENDIKEITEGDMAPTATTSEVDFERSCRIYRKFLKENFYKKDNGMHIAKEEINSL